jgi:hypothetical protein
MATSSPGSTSSTSTPRCTASTHCPDCTGCTAPMPCIWTRRLAARLLVVRSHQALLRLCRASGRAVSPLDFSSVASRRIVVNYFASVVRPGASAHRAARHAARHAARRRLLRLAQARRRPLCLRRASGCLGTSRGSSRRSSSTTPPRAGSSSTTSPPSCVRVPQHVARLVTLLVVDYFASVARPGASARRTAHHAARRRLLHLPQARRRQLRLAQAHHRQLRLAQAHRRLLRLHLASGCLGTSRGSSSTTSPTPRIWVPRHVVRLIACR